MRSVALSGHRSGGLAARRSGHHAGNRLRDRRRIGNGGAGPAGANKGRLGTVREGALRKPGQLLAGAGDTDRFRLGCGGGFTAHDSNGLRVTRGADWVFKISGNVYEVVWGEERGFLKPSKGLDQISKLLRFPNPVRPIAATDLMGIADEAAAGSVSQQPLIDEQALRGYKEDLIRIGRELEHARKCNLPDEIADLERELQEVVAAAAAAKGLGAHDRKLGGQDPAENARRAVGNNLARTFKRLERATPPLPRLSAHLRQSIRTEGTAYAYRPPTGTPCWTLA